ncbi:MAG: LamG domain-containing protein [Roseibacillus sp.]|nr:LamG domain-containing protein [Roseibacillus sp.]
MNTSSSRSIFRKRSGRPILSAALLASLASLGSTSSLTAGNPVYTSEVLADNPVAYYQFDETTGTIAADSAAHPSGPFNGTYTGAVALGTVGAHPNLGTAADLTGGFVEAPIIGIFQDSTIEAWLQMDTLAAGCCTSIASAGNWSSQALHWNIKSGGDLEHAVNGQGNSNTTPGAIVADGLTWYHIVVTQNAGETTTYIDGVAVADNGINHAGPVAFGNTNFQIGAWNGARLLDGRIDEFAIYDSALSAGRVQAHFNASIAAGGTDNDGDGLPNDWETANNLDPDDDGTTGETAPGRMDGPHGADGDPDDDGLSNRDELVRNTDPQDDDSDDDTLNDGNEINIHGSNPNSDDTDGDDLKDGDEINIHNTDPARADSDGDGLDDGDEVNTHSTQPDNPDSDGDGFSDGQEVSTLLSDPNNGDDPPIASSGGTPYSKAVLGDGPVAYYRFEEQNGTIASDSSISGKHGTYTGSIGLGAASFHPNLGSAADFTGGHIDAPNTGSFTDSTVEVWLQIDILAGGCCTSIASAGQWTARGLHWNLKSDFAFEHAVNGQGNSNTTSNAFVADSTTWYHLVVTQNAGDTTTFVNGVAVPDNGINHAGPIDFGNSNFQIGAWNGGRLLDGRMDEFAIYDHALTPEQVLAHYEAASADGADPLGLAVRPASGGELELSWESTLGKLYDILVSPDLSSPRASWAGLVDAQDIAADPSGTNTLVIALPFPGEGFVAVREKNPPPLFSDDLETGAAGWTTLVNDASGNTEWELGSPNGSTGPLSGADDSGNAWCTNLGNYGANSDISLRTPIIDLTGITAALLSFDAYRDADGFGDTASVRFLRSDDQAQLGVDVPIDMTIFDLDYVTAEVPVPAIAIGESVLIEFIFVSDGSLDAFSGLCLDNVKVQIP